MSTFFWQHFLNENKQNNYASIKALNSHIA
jgi:hypothetical protein